jgi:hypothetical protein
MKLVHEGVYRSIHDATQALDVAAGVTSKDLQLHAKRLVNGYLRLKIYELAHEPKQKPRAWKDRKCFHCGASLSWQYFLKQNKGLACRKVRDPNKLRDTWTRKKLQAIWNDGRVQILCCGCYGKALKEEGFE